MAAGQQIEHAYRMTPQVSPGLPPLHIHNRRYLGGKTRLLQMLNGIVQAEIGTFESIADLFAGTGVVGHHFNAQGVRIISADLLMANVVPLRCFLTSTMSDLTELQTRLQTLASLAESSLAQQDNYFSQAYGDRFFPLLQARQIGLMREQIAAWHLSGELTDEAEAILLTSLLYASDRIANTCGHYDAYRLKLDAAAPLTLALPHFDALANVGNQVLHGNANALIEDLDVDVLYLDPPYNSRQYSDTYHLLENLITWQKPPLFGKARKMERRHLKSDYCSSVRAASAFTQLIAKARCRHILVSYNNMGKKGDVRSNACIPDPALHAALEARGPVKVFEQPFQHFSTGLREIEGHTERVFYCRVEI